MREATFLLPTLKVLPLSFRSSLVCSARDRLVAVCVSHHNRSHHPQSSIACLRDQKRRRYSLCHEPSRAAKGAASRCHSLDTVQQQALPLAGTDFKTAHSRSGLDSTLSIGQLGTTGAITSAAAAMTFVYLERSLDAL